MGAKLSDDYFNSRPRAKQIGAWASIQSHEMLYSQSIGRAWIVEIEKKFEGQDVPRPDFWAAIKRRLKSMNLAGRP